MKRRRFGHKSRPKEEMSLQITSMADVFTIILVFLLKSFSTGVTTLSANDINLPNVKEAATPVESLKVEIGKEAVILDGKTVTHLSDFHFDSMDLEGDKTSRSLNTALIEQMRKQIEKKQDQRAPASVAGAPATTSPADETSPETLLILADQQAPYAIVKSVLASATNAGFRDFKLIVVEDQ